MFLVTGAGGYVANHVIRDYDALAVGTPPFTHQGTSA